MPTWKATPNDDRLFEGPKAVPNIFTKFKYQVAAFALQLRLIHSWEGVFSPGILFSKRTLWPLDNKANTKAANADFYFYERNPGLVFDQLGSAYGDFPIRSGRLAQSLEGAGKRRLLQETFSNSVSSTQCINGLWMFYPDSQQMERSTKIVPSGGWPRWQ